MTNLYDWLISQLQTNELMGAGIAISIFGWLLVQARSLPMQLFNLLRNQFSTTLTVRSTDGAIFIHLARWLATHKDRHKARKIALIKYWETKDRAVNRWMSDEDDKERFDVTFGFGRHLIFNGLTPMLVERKLLDKEGSESEQEIILTCPGRSHDPMQKILSFAMDARSKEKVVDILMWQDGGYRVMDRVPPRPLDTLFMNPGVKEGLVEELTTFMNSEDWYLHRAVPYRRGVLLEGPPGTGKTSMALALAGYLGKALYVINITSLPGDNALMSAMSQAGDGLILLEDVDALGAFQARDEDEDEAIDTSSGRSIVHAVRKRNERKNNSGMGVTLSGVLNAIDGVASRHGRVLIMTTNHPEKLDAAVLRPGRTDSRHHLDKIGADVGARMFERFFPGESATAFVAANTWPMSPAECQEKLLTWDRTGVVSLPAKEAGS